MSKPTRYVVTPGSFTLQPYVSYLAWEEGDPKGAWMYDHAEGLGPYDWFPGRIMADSPPYFYPHMQDCYYERVAPGSTVGINPQPPNGGQTITVWLSSGRCVEIPIGYVIHEARSHVSDESFQNSLLPAVPRAYHMYAQLQQHAYTRQIVIRESPFDTDFSIWYLVVDLVQLPDLVKSLKRSYRRLMKYRKCLNAKTSFQEASNNHLAVSFGVLPTLADFREIMEILFRWVMKGSPYSKSNKMFTRGYTLHGPTLHNVTVQDHIGSDYTFHYAGADVRLRLTADVGAGQLFSTVKYYFHCPEFTGVLNRIKQFIDQLGLLDPAAIWDVIPFSFLVDWMLPVSSWLQNNLKPTLFPATPVILDWCESIGRDIRWRIDAYYQTNEPDGPNGIEHTSLLAHGTIQQYARVRQHPRPLEVSTDGMQLKDTIVNPKRSLLSGSLVAQRVLKHKPRSSPAYGFRFLQKLRENGDL